MAIHEEGDAAQGFVHDYLELLDAFRAMPSQPNLFLVLPPPLYTDGIYTMNKTLINSVLPQLLKSVATTALDLEPIDVYGMYASHCDPSAQYWCDWTIDGCHPNDVGYGQLAGKVAESLHAACPSEEGRRAMARVAARSSALAAALRNSSAYPEAAKPRQ